MLNFKFNKLALIDIRKLNETNNKEFTIVYLEVAPLTKECSGEGIYECKQVREITIDKNGSYTAKNSEWKIFMMKLKDINIIV